MKTAKEFFNDPKNYLHKGFGITVRAEILRQLLGDKFRGRILDLGCGDGSLSLQFRDAEEIYLVDFSAAMLRLAAKNIIIGQRIELINAGVDQFVSSKKFDAVLVVGLLAHVSNWREVLRRAITFLDTRGVLVCQISDNSRLLTKLQHALNRTGERKINKIEISDVVHEAQRSGLVLKQTVRFGLMMPGMGIFPNWLLLRLNRWSVDNSLVKSFTSEVMLCFGR